MDSGAFYYPGYYYAKIICFYENWKREFQDFGFYLITQEIEHFFMAAKRTFLVL